RALLRRRQLDALLGRLHRVAIDGRRRGVGIPHLEEQRPMLAANALHARHGPILQDHRAPLAIVAGDDATYRGFLHAVFPPSVSANQSARYSRAKDMLSAPTCSTPPSRAVNT